MILVKSHDENRTVIPPHREQRCRLWCVEAVGYQFRIFSESFCGSLGKKGFDVSVVC